MYDRALAGCDRAFGRDHECTLYTLHYLGLLYRDQGNLEKAEEIVEFVWSKKGEAFGYDHFQSLATLADLCAIHVDQGKLENVKHIISLHRSSYEKLARNSGIVDQDIVRDFANLLYLSMWMNNWNSQDALKSMVELIHHFDRNGRKNIRVTIYLAKALLAFETSQTLFMPLLAFLRTDKAKYGILEVYGAMPAFTD